MSGLTPSTRGFTELMCHVLWQGWKFRTETYDTVSLYGLAIPFSIEALGYLQFIR
jgi:hypothetical protein